MLTLDRDDDLPAPSADDEDLQQFWHAYYVDEACLAYSPPSVWGC